MGKKAIWVLALLWGFIFVGMPVWAYQLPDTGITKCYDAEGNVITCPAPGEPFYGQDAQYAGPQPAYRDNSDGTVTDLNTGLMWQQGDSQNDTIRTWQEACDYCDSLILPASNGYSDWRLPNRRELMSLLLYDRFDPTISSTYFPNCGSGYYWSSTTNAQYSYEAWHIHFYSGNIVYRNKGYGGSVRCVRDAEPLPPTQAECGDAARHYQCREESFEIDPDTNLPDYCNQGEPIPAAPSFPCQGKEVCWECEIPGVSKVSCRASREYCGTIE